MDFPLQSLSLPSGYQAWFVGKYSISFDDFPTKTHIYVVGWISQPAMFDYRTP